MAYGKAGRYGPETLLSVIGGTTAPLPSQVVNVYLPGTTTKAALYTDRTKTGSGVNPVTTSTAAMLGFFADPGDYDVNWTPAGGVAQTVRVTVPLDPEDGAPDQFGNATYLTIATAATTYAASAETSAVNGVAQATNITVTLLSNWGINAAGNGYHDPAGAASGDGAALGTDSAGNLVLTKLLSA